MRLSLVHADAEIALPFSSIVFKDYKWIDVGSAEVTAHNGVLAEGSSWDRLS